MRIVFADMPPVWKPVPDDKYATAQTFSFNKFIAARSYQKAALQTIPQTRDGRRNRA